MTGLLALAGLVCALAGVVLLLRAGRLEERHALAWLAATGLVAATGSRTCWAPTRPRRC